MQQTKAKNKSSNEVIQENLLNNTNKIIKHPITKGIVIIGAIYGALFISKYIIREYANVIIASKKLRNAYRM